jgi:hypothetical protein
MSHKKLTLGLCALAIAVLTVGHTVLSQVVEPVKGVGNKINRIKTAASEERFTVTDADGDVDLPGARHRLVLPEQTLVLARFSAAGSCFGGGGPCAVSIKVLNNNNGDAEIAELLPTSAPFDSSGTDGEESHTIERSLTLPAGDYDFQVRLRAVNFAADTMTFQIAGWHFTVERVVP